MTNYNKMSKKHDKETEELLEKIDEIIPQAVEVEEPVEEIVEEFIPEPEPEIIAEPVEGIVVDCDQLYVRSEASVDSEPLGVIKRDTKVRIYESESTDDFYSVCTETGLTGFCMKKFISVL